MAGRTMSKVPIDRQFLGTVRLVTLHLWRVAHSTDIDEGFAAARKLGMISEENERFMRACLEMGRELEDENGSNSRPGAADRADTPITPGMVRELQQCAIRLNAADPA